LWKPAFSFADFIFCDAVVSVSATFFQPSMSFTRPALAITMYFDPMMEFSSIAFDRSSVNDFMPLWVE
jgi:hypothetical protein